MKVSNFVDQSVFSLPYVVILKQSHAVPITQMPPHSHLVHVKSSVQSQVEAMRFAVRDEYIDFSLADALKP